MKTLLTALAGTLLLPVSAPLMATTEAAELNVYSHRQPLPSNPFSRRLKRDEDAGQCCPRLRAIGAARSEGSRSPADVVLTVDIGRLYAHADKNLFARVSSPKLLENIPAHLRDADNRWFGLSKRARVVAISRKRVKPAEIQRIEDLAVKWKGRICSRREAMFINRALLASIIAAHGEEKAEKWARGLVANLARRRKAMTARRSKRFSRAFAMWPLSTAITTAS